MRMRFTRQSLGSCVLAGLAVVLGGGLVRLGLIAVDASPQQGAQQAQAEAEDDRRASSPVKEVVVEPADDRFEQGNVSLTFQVDTEALVFPSGPRAGEVLRAEGGRLERVVQLNAAQLENWQRKYLQALAEAETVFDTSGPEQFIERESTARIAEAPEIVPGEATTLAAYQGLPKLPPDLEQRIIENCLMITDLGVVEDPGRTTGAGRWTFGYLMTQMANPQETGLSPSDFVKGWLRHWQEDVTINGFTAPARKAGIEQLILDPWPRVEGTDDLDLEKAPFRLLAIASRLDLRNNLVLGAERIGDGGAGEARFIFCAVDEQGAPLAFTVIFEYGIKRHDYDAVRDWAMQWYKLKDLDLGTEQYNAALEAITEQFAGAGVDPENPPNRSALAQLRTNEIDLVLDGRIRPTPRRADQVWEVREFLIDAHNTGELVQATVKQTPDLSFNNPANFGSQFLLSRFINDNTAQLLYGKHRVPLKFPNNRTREPFLAASSITPPNVFWDAPEIGEPEARHRLSLFTCSGCHAAEAFPGVPPFDELSDPDRIPPHFTHVRPRMEGHEALLSSFLTGVDAKGDPFRLPDPSGQEDPYNPGEVLTREFHDLRDRAHDLHGIAEYGSYYESWRPPSQRVH